MSEQPWKLAVVGATGAVGRQVLIALEGEGLRPTEITLATGARSAGTTVRWSGREVPCVGLADVNVDELDAVIFACPADVVGEAIGRFMDAGVFVIDLSGAGHAERQLPFMWPGLYDEPLAEHPGGIALPCALTTTLLPILARLPEGDSRITHLELTALEGATWVGITGPEALSKQVVGALGYQLVDPGPFPAALAFNPMSVTNSARARHNAARLATELGGLLGYAPSIDVETVLVPAPSGVLAVARVTLDSPCPEPRAIATGWIRASQVELRAEAIAARDALDNDDVIVGPPAVDGDVVRFTVVSDPIHRAAVAAVAVIQRVLDEDLW